ncbi:MAG: 6-bladed beta-propeller [Paramuribaculum sp.]|nr:6-bladed beta-propeller [Paramuribaculum sp.]
MKFICAIVACILLYSCSSTLSVEDERTIDIELIPQKVVFEDIFGYIEVVPLETNDSSLITWDFHKELTDSDIYIFDFGANAAFRFSQKGTFKNCIGKKGQGPGEYPFAYGFDVDAKSNRAYIVSALGTLYEYTLSGEFVRESQLPWRYNYHQIHQLSDGNWASWTYSDLENPALSIINRERDSVLCSFDVPVHIADRMFSQPKFFKYNGDLFVGFGFDRNVYHLSSDTMTVAYTWDFGEKNISENMLAEYDKMRDGGDWTDLQDNFRNDSRRIYQLSSHCSNNRYDYVLVYYLEKIYDLPENERKSEGYHIFHDKKTGKTYVVDKFSNGLTGMDVYGMTDDYMLCRIEMESLPLYEEYLPEGMKLSDIDPDDDNPVLARFYFKK